MYYSNNKPISIKTKQKQTAPKHPLSPFLFLINTVLEVLDRALRQEQKIKVIQIGKEEVKLPLFSEDTILYIRDVKNSTRKFPEAINNFI